MRVHLGHATEVFRVSATTAGTVTGASCYAELRGPHDVNLGPAWSVSSRKTGVGATEVPLLSVQSARVIPERNTHNRKAVLPDDIHITNPGAKDAIIRVYKARTATPSQLTGYAFTQYASGVGCPTLYDTTATAFTATSVYNLRTISLPAGGSVREAFENLRIEAGETLIVTGQTSSSTTELVVSIDGFEDF